MEATKKLNGKAVGKWLGNNAIIVMMLLVSLIVGIIHPNFFSWNNIVNLFKNVSIRYIIALGISGCLITTGNDLSAGRTAGFAACLACIFAQTTGAAGKFYPDMATLPTWLVFVLVIAICAVIGLCNGLVVSFLRVQPFIATLGMQQVVYGICLVYTGGTPIGSLDKSFTSIAIDNFLGIPLLIWVSLIVAVGFWFLYNKTRHGKYMYAIGGNESAAEVAGVNVAATKIRIYVLASCMFGLAGCLLAAKSGGASVNTAMSYELDAIAACTIGGVSTTGGVGTVPGVLVGVLVFELMKVALQFMNVNSSYTYIVQGLVIIVAVAIDIRKYLAKK
ncbi:MAG TPA: beta-methylgalactoside transporter [Candidatus Faecalibacterium intestinipullorum]|nr:beta-methylgalactoside transporter [Candidatus Faecalibacterium intestinipullorum]